MDIDQIAPAEPPPPSPPMSGPAVESAVAASTIATPLAANPALGDMDAGQNGSEIPQKRKRACTECHQSKLRCERIDDEAECKRCRRLSLLCLVDSGKRRSTKRTKLDELEREVEQLRSVVRNSGTNYPNSRASSSTPSSPISPGPGPRHYLPSHYRSTSFAEESFNRDHSRALESPRPYVETLQPPQSSHGAGRPSSAHTEQSHSDTTSSRSLEHIRLSGDHIRMLFHQYFDRHHHFFEILDPDVSPDAYYARSPMLFWAIVSVAARHQDDDSLLPALNTCVTRLLWSTIPVLPHSKSTIQAILLLAMWPFPTSTMLGDASSMLASIAKSTAVQLGLDRPEIIQGYAKNKTSLSPLEFQDAVKSWSACFIVSQSITGPPGQTWGFQSDSVIERACQVGNKYTLPSNLRHCLQIYKFMSRVNGFMTETDSSTPAYSSEGENSIMMKVLEQDLAHMEREIGPKLAATHQIILSMATLQLRSYYFFMTSKSETRRKGLLKAYTTALDIISKAHEADAKWDLCRYAPDHVFQSLMLAALLVMKIVNSSYAKYVDTKSGKGAFDNVLSIMTRATLQENDMRDRTQNMLAQLWSVHQSLALRRERESSATTRNKLGAGLLHDCVWIWREDFCRQRSGEGSRDQASPDRAHQHGHLRKEFSGAPPRNSIDLLARAADSSLEMEASRSQDVDWILEMGYPPILPIDIDFEVNVPQSTY